MAISHCWHLCIFVLAVLPFTETTAQAPFKWEPLCLHRRLMWDYWKGHNGLLISMWRRSGAFPELQSWLPVVATRWINCFATMSRRSAVKGCYSCNYSFGYKCVKIPLCLIPVLFSHNAAQPLSASVTTQCSSFVHVQNDQYTVGGSERFDTLTDLVEHYKRKGIEEVSGNWVYFKQVNRVFYLSKQWS